MSESSEKKSSSAGRKLGYVGAVLGALLAGAFGKGTPGGNKVFKRVVSPFVSSPMAKPHFPTAGKGLSPVHDPFAGPPRLGTPLPQVGHAAKPAPGPSPTTLKPLSETARPTNSSNFGRQASWYWYYQSELQKRISGADTRETERQKP